MMKKEKLLSLLPVLLVSAQSLASVNVREGGYLHSATDFERHDLHDSFRIERLYDSRSSESGLFGFGWCTRFDSRLRSTGEGRLSLFSCGAADEIRFRPVPNLAGPITEWRAENAPGERLLFAEQPSRAGRWMRPTARGEIESYDFATGRLVGITDRAGRVLRLNHDVQGRLGSIETADALLKIQRHSESGRITAIETAVDPGRPLLYHYQGLDLVRVNTPRTDWSYRYDSFHNLTSVPLNDRPHETISYETAEDRVRKVVRWNGSKCEQTFAYQTAPDVVHDHLIAKTSTRCRDRLIGEKRFDFWYERTPESPVLRSLIKVQVTTGGTPARGIRQ